jgi:AcrR family transcriptional regulator
MNLPGSTDPRVLRTRAALRQALLSLIVERGWDAVGIRDICQRAEVGRSTFYTHFADKEEVLFSGFDELRIVLRAAARAGGDTRPLGFTRGLIEHADQSKQMFRALVGKRSSHIARMRMLQLVAELAREDLAPLLPPDRLELAAHYAAGALVELLVWWVDSRSPLRPDEINALFHQLTGPALSALGSRARRSSREH